MATEPKAKFTPTLDSAPEAKAPEDERRGKVTTLAKQGISLPIGVLDHASGKFSKSFSVRRWRTKEERELGELKRKDMTMAQYVGLVVAYMCETIGDQAWGPEVPIAEKQIHVSRMYAADVFYVYCYLRTVAIDRKMKVTVPCGNCEKRLPIDADLGSMEVRTADTLEDLFWTYKLRDPIQIRGKQVESFQMSPFLWSTLEQAGAHGRSDSAAKITAILGSIVSLNDEADAIVLTVGELDDFSKFDLETITQQIDERYFGPDMSISGTCPRGICPMGGGQEFRQALDWNYNSFFGTSST